MNGAAPQQMPGCSCRPPWPSISTCPNWLTAAPRGEHLVQGIERGVKPALRKPVVKGVRHLAFYLAPGSGKGHGEGLGNAEGRIEQVAFTIVQSPVQVESKSIVSPHQCLQVLVSCLR